ncbi:guanine nucleotide exchange protein for ADP-robosylation factor [Chytridiales sp. JEL 0842]|nr:guanine nucleotide exchange protein for ADP-robosylation factor [Chytridiales sp. JEL 0842]
MPHFPFWRIPFSRQFLLGVCSSEPHPSQSTSEKDKPRCHLYKLRGHYPIIETILEMCIDPSDLFDITAPVVHCRAMYQRDPPFIEYRGVEFPKPQDINVNMMPFIMGDVNSLPDNLKPYQPLIDQCLAQTYAHWDDWERDERGWPIIDEKRSAEESQYGKVGYITVHEGYVEPGKTQRRPGLHTDSAGQLMGASCLVVDADGSGGYCTGDFPRFHWGGTSVTGGIFLASTVGSSCVVYGCRIKSPHLYVGPHGDIRHLKPYMQPFLSKPNEPVPTFNSSLKSTSTIYETKLARNTLYWLTDVTPHESLPVKKRVYRQFFRLVTSKVSGWFEEHSTPNPLGIMPACPIIKGNKFNLVGKRNKHQDLEETERRIMFSFMTAEKPAAAAAAVTPHTSPGGNSDVFFIKSALEQLLNAREAKRIKPLTDSVKSSLTALDTPNPDLNVIQTILQPFQLACQSRQPSLAIIAIDCLGKLFTYNYWSRNNIQENSWGDANVVANDEGDGAKSKKDPGVDEDRDDPTDSTSGSGSNEGGLIKQVIDTICDTFSGGENTDEKLQLQIVKALLAAVSSVDPVSCIHGSVLLRAIRTTYNIFLLSRSTNTQIVSQATLTQMVQAVFGRVPRNLQVKKAGEGGSNESSREVSPAVGSPAHVEIAAVTVESPGGESASPASGSEQSLPTSTGSDTLYVSAPNISVPNDKHPNTISNVRRAAPASVEDKTDVIGSAFNSKANSPSTPEDHAKKLKEDAELDQAFKDAYLVFRALCKLSMKTIPAPEGATDLKSTAMRSKLLSLYLIHTVLSNNNYIFFTPAPILFSSSSQSSVLFIHSVKQYLLLSFTRNAVSVVPQVFDISMDIFGRMLVGLRTLLKKEMSVIFTEIIIPIMEARNSITFNQRTSLLKSLNRIIAEPTADGGRLLVEIYLNYDCDMEATDRENIWERVINALSKLMTTRYTTDALQAQGAAIPATVSLTTGHDGLPPGLTTATLTSFTKEQVKELYSATGDYNELKKRGLELMVKGILRPLVAWCNAKAPSVNESESEQKDSSSNSPDKDKDTGLGLIKDGDEKKPKVSGPMDDPTQFQNLKHRKQVLLEGVKRFNQKPKKGMQFLLDSNCIPSRTPKDIAYFLLHTDGLNKSMIGEFLGEGEEENIAIMHAFVDEMDFTHLPFTAALRSFLQCFRLPGEAQKIDRFMLKFAERYVQNNPSSFSSADTAYVLAYSVIMLNTDQHNPQVKKRMTKTEFIKNNRGIDEGKDLQPEILEAIFDEIASNEIAMKDEQAAKAAANAPTVAVTAATDRNKEVCIASEHMAMKTEALFNNILKASKRGPASGSASPSPHRHSPMGSAHGLVNNFFVASHYEHIKPMFQLIWMSILTALSGPLQESDDAETIAIALEGFKYAIRIVCLFDLELERKAFINSLAKFTQLGNIADIRPKNLETIKTILDVAYLSGNHLGESWMDVVFCVNQLEKIQTFGAELSNQRAMMDPKTRQAQIAKKDAKPINEEILAAASSQTVTLMVDRLFTSSVKLNGTSIVEFVRALCTTSWEEISSTPATEHPKMYCLQRLIEISYYNMKRIRVEWSNIWAILGEHFNQVGCHSNTQVCFFALDKLRQLAMKFLELEELPNFKFQKDFLKPFEHVLANNPDVKIKDMALTCLQQMIQAKAKSMKSGWKAIFLALQDASEETNESILLLAFEILKNIVKNNFDNVVANLTFPDLIACVVEFCKHRKHAKISLQAIEMLRQTIPKIHEMSKTPTGAKILQAAAAATDKTTMELLAASSGLVGTAVTKSMDRLCTPLATACVPVPASSAVVTEANGSESHNTTSSANHDEIHLKFWFPILFGLHEVIMVCDLEVRTRGLSYLFDTLKLHGSTFSRESWEVVAKGVLFPMFDDLKPTRQQEHSKFANKEDMNVWLNTTLIQALRQFVDLFGQYLESLTFCVDGLLDLLTVCMNQENETLARIGSTCLQQFIENNVQKIDYNLWDKLCAMFTHLFKITTPDALFFDYREQAPQPPAGVIAPPEADSPGADGSPSNGDPNTGNDAPKPLKIVIGTAPPSFEKDSAVPDITGRPKPQKKDFQNIIVKCVLHLLVIQTLQEVLASGGPTDAVYNSLSSKHLFTLIDCLDRSYRFAKAFNEDMELRMALYRMGFMKQLPNLLKQETSSVSSYITVLIKMYSDPKEERVSMRDGIEKRLIPLSYSILTDYNTLDAESKRRNINAWRPVVVAILNSIVDFDDNQFRKHLPIFYNEVVNLLLQEVSSDIRLVLHSLLVRAGNVFNISKVASVVAATPARTGVTISASETAARESFAEPAQ